MLFHFLFKRGRLHCISLTMKPPFPPETDMKFLNLADKFHSGLRNNRDRKLRQLNGPEEEKKKRV